MLATATYHSWAISLSLLVIRVALGGMIAAHGLNKIFGGGKIAGTAGWFHSIGMRPGVPNAWAAAITEVGAGLFLILGLITPVACAGLVALMVVAIITVHRANGFFVFNAGQGIEYCLIVAAIAIGVWFSHLFPPVWRESAPPPARFLDVTRESGLSYVHDNGSRGDQETPTTLPGAVAFLDYDNDGHPDLFFVGGTAWPWAPPTATSS